jgi:hypothetical protein
MLAQTESKSKASLGGQNGRTDKSEGSDSKYDRLKKDLTHALREISNLKNQLNQAENQLNQAKENIAKERAERGSKSKKDDSPDVEVGSKRPRQQAKRAKASRPTTSSPSPPRRGFRMLPTGKNSDSEAKRIFLNRTREQHTHMQSLLAFNHPPRRRLHSWRWSPDL